MLGSTGKKLISLIQSKQSGNLNMRANATVLTEDDMEKVGKYVVKERGLEISDKGEFSFDEKGNVVFRVSTSKLSREVSNYMDRDLNSYNITKAVNWYVRNLKRFKTAVTVTSSVQENILKEEIAKLKHELTECINARLALKEQNDSYRIRFAELKRLLA